MAGVLGLQGTPHIAAAATALTPSFAPTPYVNHNDSHNDNYNDLHGDGGGGGVGVSRGGVGVSRGGVGDAVSSTHPHTHVHQYDMHITHSGYGEPSAHGGYGGPRDRLSQRLNVAVRTIVYIYIV